jgi:hypothetical protein
MARTRQDLIKLLAEFKNWYELELGQMFQHDVLLSTFDDMTKARLAKFTSRRLGHLPDYDYFNFCNIFAEDMNGTLADAPVRVEVKEPERIPEPELVLTEEKRPRGRPKKAG